MHSHMMLYQVQGVPNFYAIGAELFNAVLCCPMQYAWQPYSSHLHDLGLIERVEKKPFFRKNVPLLSHEMATKSKFSNFSVRLSKKYHFHRRSAALTYSFLIGNGKRIEFHSKNAILVPFSLFRTPWWDRILLVWWRNRLRPCTYFCEEIVRKSHTFPFPVKTIVSLRNKYENGHRAPYTVF